MLAAFAVLIAARPDTGELRLSLVAPARSDVARVEAAVKLGAFAVSILVERVR